MSKNSFWQTVLFNNGVPAITGNAGLELPKGTSAERPGSPQPGTIRFNTTLGKAEIYQESTWVPWDLDDPVSFGTIQDLRVYEGRPDYVVVFGTISPTAGGGGIFRWLGGSIEAADQVNVVSPLAGPPGRWYRVPVGSPASIDSLVSQDNALKYFRLNAAGNNFEGRTPEQVLADIGANTPTYTPTTFGTTARPFNKKLDECISVKDFGAVGNNTTDDGPAFNAAIAAVFSNPNGGMLYIPPGQYRIDTPISFVYPGNVSHPHGILGYGAELISTLGAGQDMITIDCPTPFLARNLKLAGFTLTGSGTDQDGLVLKSLGNASMPYLLNICLEDVTCQGFGRDGALLIGSIFESNMINCYFRDNGRHGCSMGHDSNSPQGIFSSFSVIGCNFGQNGQYGCLIINNAYDIGFFRGYFVTNAQYGLVAPNGINMIVGTGFENNWVSAGSYNASLARAGIALQNFGLLIGVSGAQGAYQTHLVKLFNISNTTMLWCGMQGPNSPTTVSIDGGSSGELIMEGSGPEPSTAANIPTLIVDGVTKPQVATPTSGQTVTITGRRNRAVLINPAGTLAALTITLPANPSNGQIIRILSTQIITTLTLNGGTIQGPQTTLAANEGGVYEYHSSLSKWFRVG